MKLTKETYKALKSFAENANVGNELFTKHSQILIGRGLIELKPIKNKEAVIGSYYKVTNAGYEYLTRVENDALPAQLKKAFFGSLVNVIANTISLVIGGILTLLVKRWLGH